MAVFLKLHNEEVASNEELRMAVMEWREQQEKEGVRLGELVGWCGGVVGFLRSPRT